MKLQELLLSRISGAARLARGTLHAKGCTKSGRTYYNLMYRRKTHLYSRHVGAAELAAYEEATAAYAELRELFESFVDEMTARTIREISQDAKKAKAGDSRG